MGLRQGLVRSACTLLCAGAAIALAPAGALASTSEQSILMDDSQLIYASPAHVTAKMEQIAELGINRVKVSVVWSLVAPDPNSKTKPKFDATNPNAYPASGWQRYDLIVQLAQQLGIGVYFQLTAPAPAWAVSPGAKPPEYSWSHEPNPTDFAQFAEAVGERYSGTFVPPPGSVSSPPPVVSLPVASTTVSVPNPTTTTTTTTAASSGAPLPAVTWWGIWNEPNEHAWLSPQTRVYDRHTVAYSPLLERELTNAGYSGLAASGHQHDTILIGETASRGSVTPVPFVQDLYCVNSRYQPLRGTAAAALGCPTSGSRASFVAANPGLFRAAGFAHHPYSFDHAPNTPFATQPNVITLANLGKLERALDGSLHAYGQREGMPFYLTEWGYKTNPPNPFVHTSLAEQATWLNEGEYMTWKMPRVRALAQYLLYDTPPRQGAKPGTLSYWSTFQTGLYYAGGKPKPALAAFRLPIWLPSARHGRSVAVWAELRPARRDNVQTAEIEYRSNPKAKWSILTSVKATDPEGFVYQHVAIPHKGMIRLAWYDTTVGGVDYSRTVAIS
jgi:hypothetical protein